MNVSIITNSKGTGDYVIVVANGDEIFAGHHITAVLLYEILQVINSFEFITFHEMTDEEIEDWEEVLYK